MPVKKRRMKRLKMKKRSTESAFQYKSQTSKTADGVTKSFGTAQYTDNESPSRKSNNIKCQDKGGVPRILSPFNRFANIKRVGDRKVKTEVINLSTNKPSGLSSKEKSYIICSCEARSTRYLQLKTLATNAIKENKIFSVFGSCNAVRIALLERGWVEKIPANRMNLSKIRNGTLSGKTEIHGELERLLLSNLVEKYNPNFIWKTRDENPDNTIDMTKDYSTMVNKLKQDALWTTKQGLCSSMQRNYWFYIENVAEVIGPRSYNTYESGESEGFVKDFKITACTSLLKWILSMVANDRPIFSETGNISNNVLVFALNRCKEYLFRKQNVDIDRSVCNVSHSQWNAFLRRYYKLIAKEDMFVVNHKHKLPLYLRYAKILLKEMHKYRPQLSCEGCHNIWIIKPAHNSRGRGIRMASKLGVITNMLNGANSKYVIQKYIEEPLLIHDTKFDIRQYYMVTSTYPLVIWMYTDCYLKFSSQKYNLKNYHESIHLTNNAVQRKYKNCADRNSALPYNNMWDLDTYKKYLNSIGQATVWDNVIYKGMKKSIIGIMLSCQDSLSYCKDRFEIYGCDFILDKQFMPWLIEINSCPDLNNTTQVTGKICPAVVADIIKVVIDYAADPSSDTGKFECIYRQAMTTPRYGNATDLAVKGYPVPPDYFYTGNLLNDKYDEPQIGKTKDMNHVFNKLKRYYNDNENNMMKEFENKQERSIEEGSDKTMSETELNNAAAAYYTDEDVHAGELLSEAESSERSEFSMLVSPITSNDDLKRSVTDDAFRFSKLDDGPRGKASYIEISASTSIVNNSFILVDNNLMNKKYSVHFSKSQSNLVQIKT